MIIDPAQTPKSEFYPWLIRCIVPRPIAWVSTISREGVHNLAPFSFFTAITTEPPTLCFAPGRHAVTGRKKDTLVNIEATGDFVVNVVPEELAPAMNETATDFPHGDGTYPHSRKIADDVTTGMTPAQKQGVVRSNVRALYHL